MIKKKYPGNKPELKQLLNCRSLKIYRLRFLGSVFLCLREDLKGKSGRLKDFCLLVSPLYFLFFFFSPFFKTGPDEQLCVAFTFIPHNM